MEEDTFEAVSVMINQPELIKKKAIYEEGGKINMCKAMEDWKEELLKEGMERGIKAMILDNMEEGVPKERILKKLQKHFGLDADSAEKSFSRYGVYH